MVVGSARMRTRGEAHDSGEERQNVLAVLLRRVRLLRLTAQGWGGSARMRRMIASVVPLIS